MKMAPLLLSGLFSLSSPWQLGHAHLTVETAQLRKALDLTAAQDQATDRAANFAVIDGGWITRTAGSADSGGDKGAPDTVLELQSFALYALSRGKGLSDDGRRALEGFRQLLREMKAEGQVVEVSDTRIGLEGETRVCAKFASSDLAGKAWMQMQRLSAGADLVHLKPEKC
ncbi:hypothetical protein XI03_20765 [Bradyrhizobium sp. CCBAU 65884]|uniref:hypothetical protein n=1 Tax=Bradyrhizobium sp. CCBAU 65884 TaxID=722477 RepID=UPI00230559E4|nr:hypothetical protein [Bradyrhizobium sp. CCBAU 65884]MDA9476874.1 hypothetical protein [Bradyrhizobium sp. CCBAU 65884]